ncbi:ATP-binding protein [Dehalobacter sp. DCM]|uniref:hybrid sensor histidine kinase/response regulator n=1 Tax=Dehalobacter sp. DCM TaxID=2907827 RepID=UPI003081AD2C|nr:ATP-binding protein [Dehalobacter sp. DCM]
MSDSTAEQTLDQQNEEILDDFPEGMINAEERNKNNVDGDISLLTDIYALCNQLIIKDDLHSVYHAVVDTALMLTNADKGFIQVPDEKNLGALKLIEYSGMKEHKVPYAIPIGEDCSGRAYTALKRVIVKEVSSSTIFSKENRQILLAEDIQAVQSTPLISSKGNTQGILSTCYSQKHDLNTRDLRVIDILAPIAGDMIELAKDREETNQKVKEALAINEELRRMDQHKNAFLSMLSHELRNPLASIMMSLSLLDVPENNKEALRAKKAIKRQSALLSRLIDDLLDVTRISSSKMTLKREYIDLNMIISRAIDDYKEQFERGGVHLEVDLPLVPLYIEADPARITQIIGNILHNAVKFSGSGCLTAVTVYKEGAEAVIRIRDNGIGIERDLLEDLFKPFAQAADRNSERNGQGLGLGLAIVKGIVELHGGIIEAFSEGLGKGTEFIIRLPLGEGPNNLSCQQNIEDKKAAQVFKILVIDDVPDIAEILSSLLCSLGHDVISAKSGKEGLDKARTFHPDVILCDIGMIGIDGYEVAQRIRNDSELKDVYLIALSGYAQEMDIKKSMHAGFDKHLAKPLDLAVLDKILLGISKR